MRKLLLAGIAAVAVGFTGAASAANMNNDMAKPKVEPGKVVIRLDTQVLFLAGYSHDNAANKAGPGKQNQEYGFDGNVRLYPSIDAMTTNGVKYGASVEIRTNSAGSSTGGASGNSAQQTFYIRRAYGYVGTDQLGTVRFGQIDGPLGLMQVGTMQGFGDGGVNGDVPDFVPSFYAWQFPFSVGNEYAQNKLVYLSPSFAGFDFGISFAPSTAALLGSVTSASVGRGPTTSAFPGDSRPRNIIELNARYRGTFSGVGIAANVGYLNSGRINDGTGGFGSPKTEGLSVIDAGLQGSYMGVSVGGHMATGRFNGQMNLTAKGEKDAMMYILGAIYENGPYTVGAHYSNISQPGVFGNGARKIEALAAGANWAWAPGATLFAEFETGRQSEAGRSVHGTGFVIGQKFKW